MGPVVIPCPGPTQTSNFVVELHFDGTNGSTTFPNTAIGGSTAWTSSGAGAVLAAPSFKFGTANLSVASSNYAHSNNSADFGSFGTGEFAIGFWIMRGSVTGARQNMFGMGNGGLTGGYYYGAILANNTFLFSLNDAQSVTTAAIADTNPHYIEINRVGNNLYTSLDGTFSAATDVTGVSANAAGGFSVGTLGDFVATFYTGRVDEFVIVKGAHLHSASFTPAASPFCS
jgi:hypothetical protein